MSILKKIFEELWGFYTVFWRKFSWKILPKFFEINCLKICIKSAPKLTQTVFVKRRNIALFMWM